jgi:ABC-type bacteriocin/lantibiotic exporter with double-glycine peptidase domain
MELGDCGAACLATVLRGHGLAVDVASLRDLTSTGRDGVSAAGLLQAARHHGFAGQGVRCPVERLDELPPGAVLHWGGNHFVVLTGRSRRGLHLLDPALGHRVVPMSTVREQYSGVALLLTPPAEPVPVPAPQGRAPRWLPYRPFVAGVRRPLLGALLLAAAVQACALVYPLVLRRVVGQADQPLPDDIGSLAVGLTALALAFLLAQVGRLLFLTAVQRLVDVSLTLGVLRHLARLPYAFLARRSTGDLALRVRSTFAVRSILTASALSAVLDGTLVLGYLAVILVVDAWFALLTLVALGVQAGVVALTWRRMRQSAAEALEAQTTAQSALLELVAGFELL